MSRKKKILIITIIFAVICTIVLFISSASVIIRFAKNISQTTEDLLLESTSPDGNKIIAAYKVEAGATVDFSIKVYLLNEGKKKLIYNAYHEDEAEILWLSNDIVVINDHELNLGKGEKYDWKKNNE